MNRGLRMNRPGTVPAEAPESRGEVRAASGRGGEPDTPATEPCLHCGHPVAVRLMGCKGGHCPNCRHPYPHGDCSD